MANEILVTRGLTKRYGNHLAVDHVELSIQKGQIYGLVGRNGAGKTTIIRMVTAQTVPTEGEVSLFGASGERELSKMRARTGAMVETPSFYPYLTARQNLEYYRIQRGIPGRRVVDEVLELCTLDERLIPCIDFGHLYARSLGADDGAEAFGRMLDRVESVLGQSRASVFHSHFSHIQFTPGGGEKCHRTFDDDDGYGPDWAPLARAIARRGWSPTFICESAGTQAKDALTMKRIYQEVLTAQG